MSNNHKKHNYYNIIIDDMEIHIAEEFIEKARLLSISIDLERFEDGFDGSFDELEVKTLIEKKTKDVLFLKTTLLKNKDIIAKAHALWTKES
ncbi:hypothetical protein N9H74_01880 [Hyphomicrobiales bacterium]|nr:hypothetical protein [Hyphomicrobiales bacterium]